MTLSDNDIAALRAIRTSGRCTARALNDTFPEMAEWKNRLTRMVERGLLHVVSYGNRQAGDVNEYEISAKALTALSKAEQPAGEVVPPRQIDFRAMGTYTGEKWPHVSPERQRANEIKSRGF